jgi:hypothetical protein
VPGVLVSVLFPYSVVLRCWSGLRDYLHVTLALGMLRAWLDKGITPLRWRLGSRVVMFS